MKVQFNRNVPFPHSWLTRQRYLGKWETTERWRSWMEHRSCVQNQPHENARLVEWCYNYEWLNYTIIYHTVTRIYYENSITACDLSWVCICQERVCITKPICLRIFRVIRVIIEKKKHSNVNEGICSKCKKHFHLVMIFWCIIALKKICFDRKQYLNMRARKCYHII